MKLENLVGRTLDNKYKIERELGRGGMGTVYLATHVGTERPVAVKIIAPQFMEREEFVERFRREARAAGRLRHPNVVNVTDFGLSETEFGRVAYLVMEYLDGCTLGEILEEEKKMPFSWSLDIIEQICSAVQQAHEQGIIHRDLKPDNIWLEPNQRGGYTVKVLDFGIAKLEEHVPPAMTSGAHAASYAETAPRRESRRTIAEHKQADTFGDARSSTVFGDAATMAFPGAGGDAAATMALPNNGGDAAATMALPNESKTLLAEAGTMIQPADIEFENKFENKTAMMPSVREQIILTEDNLGTKLMSAGFGTNDSSDGFDRVQTQKINTSELTHVGAVLGTPLYMSPEQCRGERLSARSDIYSLGVIAYQMLGGKTPFGGDFTAVMTAHKETAPPALDAKKVPKKVKRIIHASLAKNPDERPQTAESFASELRAQSEGIGTLLRRALTIYSEHLPKFLSLSLLLYTPLILITFIKVFVDFLGVSGVIDSRLVAKLQPISVLLTTLTGIGCGYLLFGTITWIVTQLLAVPLRPVSLREAFKATRKKSKTLFGTGAISTIFLFIGYALCFIPGLILSVTWSLIAPVVMMENLRGRAAMRRSKLLVKRSLPTAVAALCIMFMIPFFTATITTFLVSASVKSVSGFVDKISAVRVENSASTAKNSADGENKSAADEQKSAQTGDAGENGARVNIDLGRGVVVETDDVKISPGKNKKNMGSHIKAVVGEDLTAILMLPIQILMASFSSIVVALLYIKTRLVGGESMKDLLAQFQEADRPHSNWQKRIRARVEQSGRQTSRT